MFWKCNVDDRRKCYRTKMKENKQVEDPETDGYAKLESI